MRLPANVRESVLAVDDYTYDSAGRRTSITYPLLTPQTVGYPGTNVFVATPMTYTTTYDSMGRPFRGLWLRVIWRLTITGLRDK